MAYQGVARERTALFSVEVTTMMSTSDMVCKLIVPSTLMYAKPCYSTYTGSGTKSCIDFHVHI